MRADHAALLAELLTLVDERHRAALQAAIADIGRMDKVERLKIEILSNWGEIPWRCSSDYGAAHGYDVRAAIDGVPE